MKSELYTLKNQLRLILILALSFIGQAQEGEPFYCDYNAYLFQYNDVFAIDLASGDSYRVATDITPGNVNAAAYNPADGYIWGSLSSPAKSIVKIGKDFSTTTYYIEELPNNGRYIGDVSATGMYFLKGGGTTYYKIDLDPESSTYIQHNATESLSQNISIHDWAFNAVDNQLYTVEKNSNILYRINPDNGQVTSLGVVPILDGNNYTYGAVYFDADGRFYVSANQTGTIYVIQAVQNVNSADDMESNLFAFGPSSASNDGARCPTAPVLQEDCDNGIDDDGDGLIDCEDPSCSGFGSCEVIEPPVSGGDGGGLESNNRLSEQINKRNFNRAKSGYTFNRSTAPRFERPQSYLQRNTDNSFTLEDFIPVGVIGETEAINSSPTDLLEITNATEIFAVDYMNVDTPIATILALKTEDGVYEHTKYICDRLLGAELITVSTININEQQFIKSVIKNPDGTHEFVLSLSAKVINNDAEFAIESHWNLDKYEENTTFYNFQIWANTVDDLYLLGAEVLNLLAIEKPIVDYNNSEPPVVFVRKGEYNNGGLDLQIININATQSVNFDAGYRTSETAEFSNLNMDIDLNGQYLTNIRVETGLLFDIGFRIGDGITTPDDLFMSDGPWGLDDSQEGTNIDSYEITTNDYTFAEQDRPIERNVYLDATTNTYVAVYRALTPRFKAIDLTTFSSLKFKAKGTGQLEIAFVKESITDWGQQFKRTVTLSDTCQTYLLPIEEFASSTGNGSLDDVVTLVFTMVSQDGTLVNKKMTLENLRLSNNNALSVEDFSSDVSELRAFPNPMDTQTELQFTAAQNETISCIIYNTLGKEVYKTTFDAKSGKNSMTLKNEGLVPGLYFCKLQSQYNDYKIIKLLVK
ncbi:hypothetical protein BTO05_11250 [Winogradskyella sp. PC-19]|uniref:T9SS type A sorting domain-containing protein n=1 Tax=unclassified Winogradskyella TaxID=2615021 RepID=UPI000B3C06B1|nr:MULTISPECIES: T9SS type A sorting domain-containing protein [unclassified Winogradskyella]ARV10183.1 hypothetical protein BTO05_11250 [Winogradskyella sp. PC-19]RZN83172.1 MAG: T9SS type A sorting domain-containing protein [Winogradskyella sp.]